MSTFSTEKIKATTKYRFLEPLKEKYLAFVFSSRSSFFKKGGSYWCKWG